LQLQQAQQAQQALLTLLREWTLYLPVHSVQAIL